jgi:hypothetical protein
MHIFSLIFAMALIGVIDWCFLWVVRFIVRRVQRLAFASRG